ncbi:MAG: NAD(+) synthase, partial [Muribaculaceae bacterium]|nr:NAD(+) synthase [Muribaculaceae bacterium]
MENYGYLRVGTAVPQVNVADVDFNVANIVKLVHQASKQKVQVLVFPELSITGYTCGDLFASECLLEAAEQGIAKLCGEIAQESMLMLVGAPLRRDGQLFNCAVAIQNGNVIAVVPKSFIPNYKEFYEKRWFAGCVRPMPGAMIKVNGIDVPFGTDLLLEAGAMKLGVELCEDLWAPMPPSASLAINGANVIANLSASNELVGKHDYLLGLIKHQSATCIAAYVYSSCGYGESTTDVVFGGNAIIAENGHVLCESERFVTNSRLEIADVDIEAINNDRRVKTSFSDSKERFRLPMRHIALATLPSLDLAPDSLKRYVEKAPFIPTENSALQSRCSDIINIQAMGLMRRMEFTGIKKLVIGISGGIDSTLALMVAVEAFDRLNIDRKDIYGITMPGFGTTDRTHDNAVALMKALGISTKEIPIVEAVKQHFNDIEHDINNHDVTYENCQARERTQILMDFANKVNALVLGTGDLSELALGWATYNGDHMS